MSVRPIDLVGVVSPAAVQVAEPHSNDPPLYKTVVPGAALGVAGAVLWKKHRVLGFLLGDAVGVNAARLWRGHGDDRVRALCNMGTAGVAAASSLMMPKHPFYGWVLGFAVGTVASAFIPGSNAYRVFRRR